MPQKKAKLVVAELKKRSEKGLALAGKILLEEKMEPPELRKACKYYVDNWHGFYHPGLFSMACEAVGGNPDDSLAAQAAIAILSAAFDLHDDILDRSKMSKYESPTIYGKFGMETALLLGDACLIEGFKVLVDSLTNLPEEKRKQTLQSTKDLLFEVGNAHSIEIYTKQSKNITLERYLKICELKGASMEAFLMLGGLFGGGNESEVKCLARIGRTIGILVALRDDLVDVFDVDELSQRVLVKDLPLPLLFALQEDTINATINNILLKRRITSSELQEIVSFTLQSKPAAKIKYRMQLLIDEGLSLLNKLSNKKLQKKLQAVISVMLEDLELF
jgi:geranylgeranyl pyrophosphate synthase